MDVDECGLIRRGFRGKAGQHLRVPPGVETVGTL